MNKIYSYLLIGVCFILTSCEFNQHTNSTGKYLEIILVQGSNCSKNLFDIFRNNLISAQKPILESEVYGERKNYFKVIPILEKDFSSIFRTHKNIVIVNSSKEFNVKVNKDVWSKNQNVYFCSIGGKYNEDAIIKFSQQLAVQIKDNEIKRRVGNYHNLTPPKILSYLQKKHQLSICLPNRFFIIDSLNETLYLRGETKTSSQMVLISPFLQPPKIENILLEKNKIAKDKISSSAQGSYLRIEDRTPIYIDSVINSNQENITIKGLWRMEGDFMGGSFMSSLIYNPITMKRFLISLYLYAPGENKANYLLDLEAILKSVKYINN